MSCLNTLKIDICVRKQNTCYVSTLGQLNVTRAQLKVWFDCNVTCSILGVVVNEILC
jgi:hypothetical protein